MKNRYLIFFLIFFLLIICCQKEKTKQIDNSIYIHGIINFNEILNFTLTKNDILLDEQESYLIQLDSATGSFNYTLPIEFPQTILLKIQGKKLKTFFVFPSDTILIQFKDSLIIKFYDSNHQGFNNNLKILNDEIEKKEKGLFNALTYKDLSESELKKRIDSVRLELDEGLKLLSTQKGLTEDIINLAQNDINFNSISHMLDYKLFNANIFRIKRNVPNSYYTLFDTISSNFNNLLITEYAFKFFNRIQWIYNMRNVIDIIELKPSLIRELLLLKVINQNITDKNFVIAKELMDKHFSSFSNQNLKIKTMNRYQTLYKVYKNPAYSAAILKSLINDNKSGILKELTKNNPNKVLYLKFWAPWCAPCMAQLPYIKKIEEKFNPNDFGVIHICIPHPKDKWRATIKGNNISGIHYLLNDNQYNELKVLLNMQGIPTYVLINKQGDIIDKNAPIPGEVVMGGINSDLVNKIKNLIDIK